jgi:hypothetical protein
MLLPTRTRNELLTSVCYSINYATVDYSDVNFSKAYSEGMAEKTATAPAATTTAVVATPSAVSPSVASSPAASSSSSSSSGSSSSGLWNNVVGVSNSLNAFGPGIAPVGTPGDNYFGNYGGTGKNYGSNVLMVDSVGSYQFTNTFKNSQSKSITVNIWNKVGPDCQVLSGPALAPTKTTLTFVLKPGGSQVVAFQDNSNIGWAQPVDAIIESGAFQTTWGECNFVSGGSGYDVSAINNPSNDYHMTITSVENPSCTSDITQNYWKTATDPVGSLDGTNTDGSCYVPGTSMHLETTMGG